jgi:fused signal recognition particle receptor
MALFWKRKKKENFISLGLNDRTPSEGIPEGQTADSAAIPEPPPAPAPPLEKPAALDTAEVSTTGFAATLEPSITGEAPASQVPITTAPVVNTPTITTPAPPRVEPARRVESPRDEQRTATTTAPPAPRPVPSRSPFASSSVLGLNRSMEELQAEEAALEQAFAARFRRAVSATRETLSDRIDTVFQNRKQIDATLLDELEEALIGADLGVPTTLEILDTVRRGVARKQINDPAALKDAIKNQILDIFKTAEANGVKSELEVGSDAAPYVLMIVGVNGVGKTTTIGKLAQRIKAEGNDVLICAADTFRAAAGDQLAIWAERTGVPLIQAKARHRPRRRSLRRASRSKGARFGRAHR